MYEALSDYADTQRRVYINLKVLCDKNKMLHDISIGSSGVISPTKLKHNLDYLKSIGSVRMNGNRVKILGAHPDELVAENDRSNPVMPEAQSNGHSSNKSVVKVPKSSIDLMEAIDSIPPEILADAVSRKMWERYEWALSELGKMHATLEVKDAELQRLRMQVQDREPVNAKDAARFILS